MKFLGSSFDSALPLFFLSLCYTAGATLLSTLFHPRCPKVQNSHQKKVVISLFSLQHSQRSSVTPGGFPLTRPAVWLRCGGGERIPARQRSPVTDAMDHSVVQKQMAEFPVGQCGRWLTRMRTFLSPFRYLEVGVEFKSGHFLMEVLRNEAVRYAGAGLQPPQRTCVQ